MSEKFSLASGFADVAHGASQIVMTVGAVGTALIGPSLILGPVAGPVASAFLIAGNSDSGWGVLLKGVDGAVNISRGAAQMWNAGKERPEGWGRSKLTEEFSHDVVIEDLIRKGASPQSAVATISKPLRPTLEA